MGGDGGSNREAPSGVTGETDGRPTLTREAAGETEESFGEAMGGGGGPVGSGGGGEATFIPP